MSCRAETYTDDETCYRGSGWHVCIRVEDEHDGPHECDQCEVTW